MGIKLITFSGTLAPKRKGFLYHSGVFINALKVQSTGLYPMKSSIHCWKFLKHIIFFDHLLSCSSIPCKYAAHSYYISKLGLLRKCFVFPLSKNDHLKVKDSALHVVWSENFQSVWRSWAVHLEVIFSGNVYGNCSILCTCVIKFDFCDDWNISYSVSGNIAHA